jgi:hypothetical protein
MKLVRQVTFAVNADEKASILPTEQPAAITYTKNLQRSVPV